MKTEESLSKSADGALKDAIREATQLLHDLRMLQKGDASRFMPKVRQSLAKVTQRAHEFSAYHNALHTS